MNTVLFTQNIAPLLLGDWSSSDSERVVLPVDRTSFGSRDRAPLRHGHVTQATPTRVLLARRLEEAHPPLPDRKAVKLGGAWHPRPGSVGAPRPERRTFGMWRRDVLAPGWSGGLPGGLWNLPGLPYATEAMSERGGQACLLEKQICNCGEERWRRKWMTESGRWSLGGIEKPTQREKHKFREGGLAGVGGRWVGGGLSPVVASIKPICPLSAAVRETGGWRQVSVKESKGWGQAAKTGAPRVSEVYPSRPGKELLLPPRGLRSLCEARGCRAIPCLPTAGDQSPGGSPLRSMM